MYFWYFAICVLLSSCIQFVGSFFESPSSIDHPTLYPPLFGLLHALFLSYFLFLFLLSFVGFFKRILFFLGHISLSVHYPRTTKMTNRTNLQHHHFYLAKFQSSAFLFMLSISVNFLFSSPPLFSCFSSSIISFISPLDAISRSTIT